MKRQEEIVFSLGRLMKFGLSLLGVLCLLAGPGWSQEQAQEYEVSSTGSATGWIVFEYDPSAPGPDFVSAYPGFSAEGTDSVLGPYTCGFAGRTSSRFLGEAEPPAGDIEGVCDPASAYIWSYTYDIDGSSDKVLCGLENTGQIFTWAVDSTIACVPHSCFGNEPDPVSGARLPQVGCTSHFFGTATLTLKDGSGESASESVRQFIYEEVEWDANRGLVAVRGNFADTYTSVLTTTIPEDERPARDVAIEVPAEGSTMSGIGVISGWSCLGGDLKAEISDADGVIATVLLAHGTPRADTEPTCGDSNNGFSATMNWTLLGSGERTIRLIQNGEQVASHSFSVLAFEEEFITGMWMTTVPEFPAAGRSATVEWDESQQRFGVTEIK